MAACPPTYWLPLSKGHDRGIIWSTQDAEFYANVLKLPHWQNKNPCHECDAKRPVFHRKKCPDGKSVKILKEAEQDFVEVSPTQALLVKRSNQPLFSIEGVSTALVRGDRLHILYSTRGGWGLTLQEACSTICATMMAQGSKELPQPKDSCPIKNDQLEAQYVH